MKDERIETIFHRKRLFMRSMTLLEKLQNIDLTETIWKKLLWQQKIVLKVRRLFQECLPQQISRNIATAGPVWDKYGANVTTWCSTIFTYSGCGSKQNIRRILMNSHVTMRHFGNRDETIGQACDLIPNSYKNSPRLSTGGIQSSRRTETIEILIEIVWKKFRQLWYARSTSEVRIEDVFKYGASTKLFTLHRASTNVQPILSERWKTELLTQALCDDLFSNQNSKFWSILLKFLF